MIAPTRRLLPVAAALLLAACGSTGIAPGPAPGPATGPDPPTARVEDRWFVAVRPEAGAAPFAERHRRIRRADDVLVQEVVWGPSFEAVATARHGVKQVAALIRDDRGLWVDALDGEGRPRGMRVLEVGAPFTPGTTWIATLDRARDLVGTIAAVEDVATPGGTVAGALRVEVRSRNPHRPSITTWYDAGLRPVRSEIRDGEGRLLESRAALADGDPTPEQAAAALRWARERLGR